MHFKKFYQALLFALACTIAGLLLLWGGATLYLKVAQNYTAASPADCVGTNCACSLRDKVSQSSPAPLRLLSPQSHPTLRGPHDPRSRENRGMAQGHPPNIQSAVTAESFFSKSDSGSHKAA